MSSESDSARFSGLLESAKLLHGSLELEPLLDHLLRTVMGRLLVRRALVALEGDGGDGGDRGLVVAAAKGLPAIAKGSPLDREALAALGVRVYRDIGDEEHRLGVIALASPPGTTGLEGEQLELVDALLGI